MIFPGCCFWEEPCIFPKSSHTRKSLKDQTGKSGFEEIISRRQYEKSWGQLGSTTDVLVSFGRLGLQSCPEINGRSVLCLPYQERQAAANISRQVGLTFSFIYLLACLFWNEVYPSWPGWSQTWNLLTSTSRVAGFAGMHHCARIKVRIYSHLLQATILLSVHGYIFPAMSRGTS